MELFYFKSEKGNFGDDLNPWLWGQIFGDLSKYQCYIDFIGIGSILDDRINYGKNKKIIFGAGVRDFKFKPENNYDVRFVRGPLSSQVFNNAPYITDSAYCLALIKDKIENVPKIYDCSIIPYFHHTSSFNWSLFEKLTGIHVIYPSGSVEIVIDEIAKSSKIISGAMHGAIIADVLRIPWKRLRFGKHGSESFFTSELKWHDWLYSIKIYDDLEVIRINEKLFNYSKLGALFSKNIQFIQALKTIKKEGNFYLSEDVVYNEIKDKLREEIRKFKFDYSER